MNRYTVIGAFGFVGARLVKALRARGDEVYTPERGDPELLRQNLGHVFYCAGLTGDFMSRPFDTVEAHVGLLTSVLRSARFERLIYLSSTRLYDSLGSRGGREDDILEFDVSSPRNVYDLSKALGENLCLARSEGRGSVARLSNLFDWTDDAGGFLSDLLKRARWERSIRLETSPHAGRDYIHVDDVIAALLAMDAAGVRGIVNIARGEVVSNGEIAQVFADAGWRIAFTTDDGPAQSSLCDVGRLAALGVRARSVRQVLSEILANSEFFVG